MKRMFIGVAGLFLVAFAVAFAASAAQADTVTQAVGEAGTVTFTVDGDSVAFVTAAPADGWTYTLDRADGDHLKVTFRNASGAEIEFEVEAGGTGTSLPNDTTGSTLDDDDDDDDDSTSTTIDDGDDDDDESDDNSGPGSSDEGDDDSSGPGSGDEDDDDNSGPGSGDEDDDDDDSNDHGDDDDTDDDDSDLTTTTVAG